MVSLAPDSEFEEHDRAPGPAGAAVRVTPSPGVSEVGSGGARLAGVTPNWFASVMGTGIVAVAAVRLPDQFPGATALAAASWALAAGLLVVLVLATAARWKAYPQSLRGDLDDAVMAHFCGAAPMAMLTVGAATLLVGGRFLGRGLGVDIDWVLWFAGTATGLVTAVTVPFLTFTRHRVETESPFGGWLMPIVPPMVSASTGALLLPYAPAGQARLSLLLCCYGMFGLSLVASMIVITLVWFRLALHGPGEERMVPTLWIVLGPLGQSVTAVNLLGAAAHLVMPAGEATVFRAAGIVYGVPVLGFALMWAVIAGAMTLRTARAHLPFSLTWWSFTFPVGTCATGATALAVATGSAMLRAGAVIAFAALVVAWLTVATRTTRGVLVGNLPAATPAVAAGWLARPLRPSSRDLGGDSAPTPCPMSSAAMRRRNARLR